MQYIKGAPAEKDDPTVKVRRDGTANSLALMNVERFTCLLITTFSPQRTGQVREIVEFNNVVLGIQVCVVILLCRQSDEHLVND